MITKRIQDTEPILGDEGTEIRQIFHPHNTLNGINYSLAQFTLKSGKKTKLHRIKSSEIYYILQGKAQLKINDELFELGENDSAYVPPNSKQFIKNNGNENLRFLCIVEPAWKPDDDELLE